MGVDKITKIKTINKIRVCAIQAMVYSKVMKNAHVRLEFLYGCR